MHYFSQKHLSFAVIGMNSGQGVALPIPESFRQKLRGGTGLSLAPFPLSSFIILKFTTESETEYKAPRGACDTDLVQGTPGGRPGSGDAAGPEHGTQKGSDLGGDKGGGSEQQYQDTHVGATWHAFKLPDVTYSCCLSSAPCVAASDAQLGWMHCRPVHPVTESKQGLQQEAQQTVPGGWWGEVGSAGQGSRGCQRTRARDFSAEGGGPLGPSHST